MSVDAFRARATRWSVLVVAAICGCTPHAGSARAQSFTPYAEFEALPAAELDSLRVKLTYVGPQDHIVQTLAFAAPGTPISLSAFAPFARPGIDYSNDRIAPLTFTASLTALEAMIDSLGTSSRVRAGTVDPRGYLSFSLLNSRRSPPAVFEAVASDTTSRELFVGLLAALGQNAEAVRLLRALGCETGSLPANEPQDVRSLTRISFGGLRRDPASTETYAGTVRVKNTSNTALAGPLTLVVHVRGNASLVSEDGRTCNVKPAGTPFVDIVSTGALAPGATVERVLRFANPGGETFDLSWGLYAGPGTR